MRCCHGQQGQGRKFSRLGTGQRLAAAQSRSAKVRPSEDRVRGTGCEAVRDQQAQGLAEPQPVGVGYGLVCSQQAHGKYRYLQLCGSQELAAAQRLQYRGSQA